MDSGYVGASNLCHRLHPHGCSEQVHRVNRQAEMPLIPLSQRERGSAASLPRLLQQVLAELFEF